MARARRRSPIARNDAERSGTKAKAPRPAMDEAGGMTKLVTLPPEGGLRADGTLRGGWWHEDPENPGRIICDLCPRACSLKAGDRGFCFVRENQGDEMVLTTYGRS